MGCNKRLLENKWFQRLVIHSFNSVALIGFLYQVEIVSNSYFRFETITRIQYSTRENVDAPNLALCFRYVDVVNQKELQAKTGIKLLRAQRLEEIVREESKLTVQQILDFSPTIDKSLQWCLYRFNDSLRNRVMKSYEDCSRYWSVDKFYMQEFVCYRYKKKVPDTYLFDLVAHSLIYSHTLFGVGLSSEFNDCSAFLAIVYYGAYPHVSRDFSSINNRITGFEKNMKVNKYYLSFARITFVRQPSPYDTHCIPGVKFESKYHCIRECLRTKLQEIERLPYTEIIFNSQQWPLKHINSYDLKNESSLNILKKSNADCYSDCNMEACLGDFTSTYISGNMDLGISTISYRIRIPQSPLSEITSNPKMFLQDFLVYICSCFGLWFGISVYHCNPCPILLKKLTSRSLLKVKETVSMRRRWYHERHKNLIHFPPYDNVYLKRLKEKHNLNIIQ